MYPSTRFSRHLKLRNAPTELSSPGGGVLTHLYRCPDSAPVPGRSQPSPLPHPHPAPQPRPLHPSPAPVWQHECVVSPQVLFPGTLHSGPQEQAPRTSWQYTAWSWQPSRARSELRLSKEALGRRVVRTTSCPHPPDWPKEPSKLQHQLPSDLWT